RTYGDYLGLDSRMLVDDYKRRFERLSDHELRPIAALSRDRERQARGPLVPPWVVIGGVLVAIVVVLYIVGTNVNNSPSPAKTVTQNSTQPHSSSHRRRTATHKRVAVPTTAKVELAATGTVYVCEVTGDGSKLIRGLIFSAGQRIPTANAQKVLLTLGN